MFKKIAAGLTALSMIAFCTACSNTTTAMTVGDYVVPAGVYLYYLNSAYNSALTQLSEESPDVDTEDAKALKAATLEGKTFRAWIEDKATELCVDFVTTEKKFDELNLSLDAETKASIDSMMEYYWASYEDTMTGDGISQESFRKVMTSSYKSEQIFDYYYAPDGEEGATEDEFRDYYAENHIRAQYIMFDLHDSEGNLLKSDGKAEVKALAEEYQKRAEDAYAQGGAEAVMAELDAIQEEYTAYQEAQAEVEAETSAEEDEAAPQPETRNKPRMLTAEEEIASEETTEEEIIQESETAETADNAEEETSGDAENDVETEEEIETSEEENTEITEEEESAEEEAGEEEASGDEAGETSGEEETLIENTDDDTDTGASVPYQNEHIISVINTDDYDDDEEIYYTPDETVYQKLLDIKEADYGKVYLVEEDEAYYLVTRYDITERMTEQDLWTENALYNVQYDKYYDAFEAKMDEWAAALTVTKNDASFKRYDPLEFHF